MPNRLSAIDKSSYGFLSCINYNKYAEFLTFVFVEIVLLSSAIYCPAKAKVLSCIAFCEAFVLLFLQPLETKLISDTSGLFEASHVARVILNDAVVSNQFLYSF